MADFPLLRSGARAQYPLTRVTRFDTHVVRFVDGGEQRFRTHPGAERVWEVRLSDLDSDEARSFRSFVDQNAGQQGEFFFIDPESGAAVPECHLADDALQMTQTDDEKHATQLRVKSKI